MNQFSIYARDVQTALNGISEESFGMCRLLLQRAKHQNATVYIAGNGGSAATASHFANDLLKMAGLRAVSLSDLIPSLTAYGNDDGWENMFAHMLKNLLLPQDVLVCISCSGSSPNVVEALRMAKSINLPAIKTMVLTGSNYECPLALLKPDALVHVPFHDIKVQEDCHLVICHALAGGL